MEKFRKVIYKPNLGSIAKVNRRTGVLYLDPEIWDRLPTDQKEFVLFHEMGHLRLQTTSEYEANKYAVQEFTKLKTLHNRTLGQKIMVMREILDKADDTSPMLAELIAGASSGIVQSLSVLGLGSKSRQKETAAQADAQIKVLSAQAQIDQQRSKTTTKVLAIAGVLILVTVIIYLTLRKK